MRVRRAPDFRGSACGTRMSIVLAAQVDCRIRGLALRAACRCRSLCCKSFERQPLAFPPIGAAAPSMASSAQATRERLVCTSVRGTQELLVRNVPFLHSFMADHGVVTQEETSVQDSVWRTVCLGWCLAELYDSKRLPGPPTQPGSEAARTRSLVAVTIIGQEGNPLALTPQAVHFCACVAQAPFQPVPDDKSQLPRAVVTTALTGSPVSFLQRAVTTPPTVYRLRSGPYTPS